MNFEVDMVPVIDLNTGTLGIVLSHEKGEQRVETEAYLAAVGAEYTVYPGGPLSPVLSGTAVLAGGTLSVTAGRVHLVGPLGFTAEQVASVKQAVLYVNDSGTFDPEKSHDKTWMAAVLSFEILENDQT